MRLRCLLLVFFSTILTLPSRSDAVDGFPLDLSNAGTWGQGPLDVVTNINLSLEDSGFMFAVQNAQSLANGLASGKVPAIDELAKILEGDVQKRINDTIGHASEATKLLASIDVSALNQLFIYLQNTVTTPEEFAFTIPNGRLVFKRTLTDVSLCALITGPGGARVTLGVSNALQLCGNSADRFTNSSRALVVFADIALGYSSVQARRPLADIAGLSASIQAETYFKIHDQWVQVRFAGRDPQSVKASVEFQFGAKGGISDALQLELEGQVLLAVEVGLNGVAKVFDGVSQIILAKLGTASTSSQNFDAADVADTLKSIFDHLKQLKDGGEDLGEASIQIAVDAGIGIGIWDTGINVGSAAVAVTLSQPLDGFYAMGKDGLELIIDKGMTSVEQLQLTFEAMAEGRLDAQELSKRRAGMEASIGQFGTTLVERLGSYIGGAKLTIEGGIYALGDIGQVASETVPLMVAIWEIPIGQVIVDGINSIPAFAEGFSKTAQAMVWSVQTAISAGLQLAEPISLGDFFGDKITVPTGTGIVQKPRGQAPQLPSAHDWADLLTPIFDDTTLSLRLGVIVVEDISLGNWIRLYAAGIDVPLGILAGAAKSAVSFSEKPLLDALKQALVTTAGDASDLLYLNLKKLTVALSARFGANGSIGAEVAFGVGGSFALEGRVKASSILLLKDDPEYDEEDGTLLAGIDIPVSISVSAGVSLGEAVEVTAEGGFTSGGSLLNLTAKDWGENLPVPAALRVAGFEVLDFQGTNTQDETIEGSGWLLLPMGGLVQATHFKVDSTGHVLSGSWKGVLELGPFGSRDVTAGEITDEGLAGSLNIRVGASSFVSNFLLHSSGVLFGRATGSLNLAGFQLANMDLSLTKAGVLAGKAYVTALVADSESDVVISIAGSPTVSLYTRSSFGGVGADLTLNLSESSSSGKARVSVFNQWIDLDVAGDANGNLNGSYNGSLVAPWGGALNVSLSLGTDGITGSGSTSILGSVFNSSDLKILPGGAVEGSFSGTLAVDGRTLSVSKLEIKGNKLQGLTTIDIAGQQAVQISLNVDSSGVSGTFLSNLDLFGTATTAAWLRIDQKIEVFGVLELGFFSQLETLLRGQLLAGVTAAQQALAREQATLDKLEDDLEGFDPLLIALEQQIREEQTTLKAGAESAYQNTITELDNAGKSLTDAIANLASAVSTELAGVLAEKDHVFQLARSALNLAAGQLNQSKNDIAALDRWYNGLDALGKAFHFIGYNAARAVLLTARDVAQGAYNTALGAYNLAYAALDAVQKELKEQEALVAAKENWEKIVAEAEKARDEAKGNLDRIVDTIANPKIDPRYIALALARDATALAVAAAQKTVSLASAAFSAVSELVAYVEQNGELALAKVNRVVFRSLLSNLEAGWAEITVDGIFAGEKRTFTFAFNFAGGDNSANLALAARQLGGDLYPDPAWTVSPWTGDASVGVLPGFTLWAYNLNSSSAATVNSVTFVGIPGVLPAVSGKFSVQGLNAPFPGDVNTLTTGSDGSSVLARDFVYNGNPGVVTFEGLTPGKPYVASFFSVGWDDTASRLNTFSVADSSYRVEQNSFGNNNGVRIEHSFTPSSTTYAVTIAPEDGNTFHLYALALSEQGEIGSEVDTWLQTVFKADSANPSIASPNADPDLDRIPNVMEYVFGTDPQVWDAQNYQSPILIHPNGVPQGLELSFPYRADLEGLVFQVQRTKDMKTWSVAFSFNPFTGESTQANGVVSDIDQTAKVVSIEIPDLSLFDDSDFWRLLIVLP